MSQFPIDKTDAWEERQDAKQQVTPIPPIPDFCKHGRTEPSCLECKEETIAKLTAEVATRDL